jgi:hypothetical protein
MRLAGKANARASDQILALRSETFRRRVLVSRKAHRRLGYGTRTEAIMTVAEAKRALPLPDLMDRLGLGKHAKKSARCPFHDDRRNSFSIWKNGAWFWKCHSECGASGDEITLIEKSEVLTRRDAVKRFIDLAQNGTAAPPIRRAKRDASNEAASPPPCEIDWHKCVQDCANIPKFQKSLAAWRGYRIEIVWWMLGKELIGLHEKDGKCLIALPVWNGFGLSGVHRRFKSGAWEYVPKGLHVTPLVIGGLHPGKPVHIFESQWDAFAFVDAYGGEENYTLIVTRGAGNAVRKDLIPDDSSITLWSQRDEPAKKWVARILKDYPRASISYAPGGHHDLNDWLKASREKKS